MQRFFCWVAVSELGWICVLMLARGDLRFMRLCDIIVNYLRSRMTVSPFPPYMPLTVWYRLSMDRTTLYAWVTVVLVICLCWERIVSVTRSAFVFLTLQTSLDRVVVP